MRKSNVKDSLFSRGGDRLVTVCMLGCSYKFELIPTFLLQMRPCLNSSLLVFHVHF